ncbi:phosphoethanolamine transferase [Polaribacter sp. MSW13]|uniref:Phosphoethanolamine transferase n=2 Tax=Polaribacter marinus TaxID=2916838 RepID=A0A9X1VKP5_9FLAO|nr:phosphoethanolamine transferase [Polaribacter marinus]
MILVVMIPNLLLVVIGEDSVVASLLKKIVFGILCFAIVITPLIFLKPKYYSWFSIILLPLILFETSIINHFKAPSSEETVATIFLTNYYEIVELVRGNIISSIWAFVLFILLVFISFKTNKNFKLSLKTKKIIFTFIFSFFSVLYIRNYMAAKKLNNNRKETFSAANYSLKVQLNKVFPLDILFKLNEAYKGIQEKKNYKKSIEKFRFNTTKKDTLNDQEIYVLVIGETARKHNFSLYNYSRKTSPNLDTLSNVFAFKNANTTANLTSLSIPFIFTRATPQKPQLKFTEPAIINGYKEAGFKTYWISNQSTGVGSVFGFYSSLADVYKNTSVSLDAANYDETLFPVLQDILDDTTTKKKFIVIHTLGSHFRYNYRYPDSYQKFKPTLNRSLSIENTNDISKKKELINSYDNSILYTDYVISNFINQIKKQNAVSFLYYISDHGENLYDDENKKLLHGYINPTKYEIEVPLIIWTSKKYKKEYTNKISNLNKNIHSRISSTNTFHTLLDLSNIQYPTEKLRKSFVSNQFDSLQIRYFYSTNKEILKLDK